MKEKMEILIDEKKLQERIKEMALQIEADYKDEEVLFVSVLKGAIFFTVDLMKNYNGDAMIDFVRVSSYEGENSTGNITLKIPLKKEHIETRMLLLLKILLIQEELLIIWLIM